MKSALMVVDIDWSDNWKPEDIESSSSRRGVVSSLKWQLGETRLNSGIVVFAIYPSSNRRRGSPQTAQFEGGENNCMGCIGDPPELPDFLEHRHDDLFEPIFSKSMANAFTNPELKNYLQDGGVEELLLAGCITFGCVLATAKGAVRNNFNVRLLRDCIHPLFSPGYTEKRWIAEVEAEIRPKSNVFVRIE